MKKLIIIVTIFLVNLGTTPEARAQADEIAQLALNIEKLTQLKSILSDLKKGYQVVSDGYGTIKNISEGNFKMHELFLDGLLAVSPSVKKYYKIASIINNQLALVKEYKRAFDRFKQNGMFKASEIDYVAGVYKGLFTQSLHNLDELTSIITANKLRMSDDERIKAIDRIDDDMEDKLSFLRHFNNSTGIVGIQRQRELKEIEASKRVYGIN